MWKRNHLLGPSAYRRPIESHRAPLVGFSTPEVNKPHAALSPILPRETMSGCMAIGSDPRESCWALGGNFILLGEYSVWSFPPIGKGLNDDRAKAQSGVLQTYTVFDAQESPDVNLAVKYKSQPTRGLQMTMWGTPIKTNRSNARHRYPSGTT